MSKDYHRIECQCGDTFIHEGNLKYAPKLCPACKSYADFSVEGDEMKAKRGKKGWGFMGDGFKPPGDGFDLPGGKRKK